MSDASFLVLFNSDAAAKPFALPQFYPGSRWLVLMDTALELGLARGGATAAGGVYPVQGRSIVLLQQQKAGE